VSRLSRLAGRLARSRLVRRAAAAALGELLGRAERRGRAAIAKRLGDPTAVDDASVEVDAGWPVERPVGRDVAREPDVSATLRSDRVLIYRPTSADATAYALLDSGAADAAWWMTYAVVGAAEQPVALRQTALRRALFTVSDRLPVDDTVVLRPLRDGVLYRVVGTQPVPRAREILLSALSTGGAAVTITEDAPRYTVASVVVEPPAIEAAVGETILFRATAYSALGDALPDRAPHWASSDFTVCLVTAATGTGECLSAGTATVTATVDGIDGTADVTVT
jgi:hypothetical protein